MNDFKKGTVKWYSQKKKYGFIIDENDNEYFFHAEKNKDKSIKNNIDIRDIVQFVPFESKKGLRAKNIKILIKGEANKFVCPSCKEEVIPKIIETERKRNIFFLDIKKSSICPNCEHHIETHSESEQEKIELTFKILLVISLIFIAIFFIKYKLF